MTTWRHRITEALPSITGTLVFIQLLSLRLGLLNRFSYDSSHASVQGIDFYSLPKAFLNLTAGRSMFDSFSAPAFGPYDTWYVVHPAFAVVMGSWLSRFGPETAYGIFSLISYGLMAAGAWLFARLSSDPLVRRLIWLLMLAAFPTYWVAFSGNIQAVPVLALCLLFVGFFQLTYPTPAHPHGEALLLAGLVLSLLTKPVVLVMFPLLLLLRPSRRAALRALAVYVVVSVLFEVVPFLNPEAIGLRQVASLVLHPELIRSTMNVYTNGMTVTPLMRDNASHWFNMVAQSDFRFMHIDVYSLPVFLDTLVGFRTPGWLYQLPLLAVLLLAVALVRIPRPARQMQAALLLLLATSLVYFLTYPTVWEYQFTAVLPVAAVLLLLLERRPFYSFWLPWFFALAAFAWLPSLYVLLQSAPIDAMTLTLIRLDKVVPVALLFFLMIVVLFEDLLPAADVAGPAQPPPSATAA